MPTPNCQQAVNAAHAGVQRYPNGLALHGVEGLPVKWLNVYPCKGALAVHRYPMRIHHTAQQTGAQWQPEHAFFMRVDGASRMPKLGHGPEWRHRGHPGAGRQSVHVPGRHEVGTVARKPHHLCQYGGAIARVDQALAAHWLVYARGLQHQSSQPGQLPSDLQWAW